MRKYTKRLGEVSVVDECGFRRIFRWRFGKLD
jgi:hypothetical protein